MEEKERIILTIFGIVAIIAVVGVIGIFNKPTYILIPLQDFEAEQSSKTQPTKISGMAVSNIATKEACLRYKKIYSNYGWFDDWQWFKDNCEAKYDLSEPTECEIGYTDEYRCEGNYLQRKWQNSECKSSWRHMHYCEYGCSNGACNPESTQCTEKYLYDYICSGGNSKRLYQKTDCSTYYKEYEVCKNGCDQKTGRCNKETKQQCDKGYLEEYRCSGNYLQKLYQYSNCLKTWYSYARCSNGCSNNKCN